MIGEKLEGDFYWFDCPDCNPVQRMIWFDTMGAYKWLLECPKCKRKYCLFMTCVYEPEK